MKKLSLILSLLFSSAALFSQNAWINEFHYDNDGTDVGEFVEVVIENPGSYTLSEFEVVLYNGASTVRARYGSETLNDFTVGDTEGNFTFYTWYPSQFQNGAPDGLVLSYNEIVIAGQFLSYEGSFTAASGVASGMTSVDVGVSEPESTLVGHSLQLSGTGTQYSDFTWQSPASETPGSLNNGQSFGGTPAVANPTAFTATAIGSDQIDLSWALNGNSDDVMLAFSLDGNFGDPVDGTSYAVSASLPGGDGTVIFNGSATSFNHTSLTASTTYYYKAWSVDGSTVYSSGVTDNATTPAAGSVSSGDIIITEIMIDPDAVGDNDGEYFEIFNATASAIDIDGWTISDDDSDSHTINNGGPLLVPAGGFLVLGESIVTTTNGGVPVAYAYSAIDLSNSGDEIILQTSGSVEIDRVEYDGGSSWPDPTGTSMIFTGLSTDDNNDGSLWVESYNREAGYTTAAGDYGSPGTNGLFQNLITTTTWTGTGNWSEGNPPAGGTALWSNGSPGKYVEVIISGTVTVDMDAGTSQAAAANVTVQSAASMTVDTGKGLTVNGTLSEEGGTISLESTAVIDIE